MSALEQAALMLAGRLADDAVPGPRGPAWSGDRFDLQTGDQLVRGPVDDGLLTGRAGVALALAAAGSLPGADPRLTSLAVTTMRHLTDDRAPVRGADWMSGDLGVARAAWAVAGLTGADDLRASAARTAARCVSALARGVDVPPQADLIDGRAGALMAVLAASLPDSAERDRRAAAELLVRALRTDAERDAWGTRWPMEVHWPPVAGLAHGAAGVALALRAARACGFDDDGLADDAAVWEDGWYDAARGGWPDLRDGTGDGPAVAWCHGALGIGIAAAVRSRLGDDGEVTFRRAARGASALPAVVDGVDGTLCHGRTGVVELHLTAARTWPRDGTHLRAARAAARPLADGTHPDGTTWLHGLRGGRTPDLLTGTAGVVVSLVRCVDPLRVPETTHPGLRVDG
ncbi:MAG: hypothetical protein IR158_10280 [Cellulomonas sp.]|uniref:lanthionine synthetase LanC family protein n=1 Tax=Cellulomonas sp. TaxID=40001 RepID=UPI0019DF73F8|nr:lanthionine synthetase LanC family protein [Cellulomonas sp.]MBF0688131.1 hypothetical protein [Cellulomonas sp.]